MTKNDFGQNFDFFCQNFVFFTKFRILAKISIIFYFCVKLPFFQIQKTPNYLKLVYKVANGRKRSRIFVRLGRGRDCPITLRRNCFGIKMRKISKWDNGNGNDALAGNLSTRRKFSLSSGTDRNTKSWRFGGKRNLISWRIWNYRFDRLEISISSFANVATFFPPKIYTYKTFLDLSFFYRSTKNFCNSPLRSLFFRTTQTSTWNCANGGNATGVYFFLSESWRHGTVHHVAGFLKLIFWGPVIELDYRKLLIAIIYGNCSLQLHDINELECPKLVQIPNRHRRIQLSGQNFDMTPRGSYYSSDTKNFNFGTGWR